ETDIFRLLDNINPLDDSFGGFLIALDERRLPLDMVRGSYHFGSVGPLNDAFLEGFLADGHRVATFPGIPPGSPWEPGGLGFPNPSFYSVVRSEAAYFQVEPMNRQGSGSDLDGLCPGAAALCPDGKAGLRRLRQANNTEGGLDPFIYPRFLDITRTKRFVGQVLQRDTFNLAAGLDVNRFIPWLNPTST